MADRAFIFDLDGTLVDTLSDITSAINLMLSDYNFEKHSEAEVVKMIGRGARHLITCALPESKREDAFITEALERYRNYYDANLVVKTHVYCGLSEVLNTLKNKGIKMAVLSNKDDRHVKIIVRKLLPYIFEIYNGFRPHFPHKPAPGAVLDIMDKLGVKPENTVYIGDSSVDVLTAQNAGVYSVGVAWGFAGVEPFKAIAPDKIFYTPEELLLLI